MSQSARHGRPTNKRMLIGALLFVTVVINYLDRSNISIAATQLAGQVGLRPAQMGLVFSAFGWTYVALQIPMGWLVDRVSPRLLYPVALVLWSLATMFLGYAGSFAGIVVLRMLVGVFEAPAYPMNNRIVLTWFRESERARAIGVYTSGQFVGLAFLTPVLAWIEARFGWQAIFVATGLLGLVWGAVWFVLYREPPDYRGISQSEIELIAQGGGIPDLGRTSSGRARDPIRWADFAIVLGRRKLWGLYLGQFGLVGTTWFFLTWFPTYLVTYRHMTFIKAGLFAALPFLAAFVGVISSGVLSDALLRRGWSLGAARKLPIIGGMLLSTSILGANYVDSQWAVIAWMTLAFFGNGVASITWSVVSAVAPARLVGLAGGMFNLMGNLAAILVPLVIGLLATRHSFALPIAFVAANAAMGALAYLFVVGTVERIVEQDPRISPAGSGTAGSA